jgi:uncharacterized DUF497 family protein
MDALKKLLNCTGFEWDKNNAAKNWFAHKVSPPECEQIFFNKPLLVQDDPQHSIKEIRYYAMGHTDENRQLFIVFTIRNNLIRVISARDMSKKERKVYKSL